MVPGGVHTPSLENTPCLDTGTSQGSLSVQRPGVVTDPNFILTALSPTKVQEDLSQSGRGEVGNIIVGIIIILKSCDCLVNNAWFGETLYETYVNV